MSLIKQLDEYLAYVVLDTACCHCYCVQGWPQERVLLSEVAQGRLLMVLQTDPTNHVKKVMARHCDLRQTFVLICFALATSCRVTSMCSRPAWLTVGGVRLLLQLDVQVRELCAFLEKAHGMAPGWLLSAPQARVRTGYVWQRQQQ